MNARGVRFPTIDSVRAMAALWVLTYHAGVVSGFMSVDSFVRPFVDQAGTAAMIFFLVSGFLLYRPFAIARLAGERMPSPVAYLWRRILRIGPGYWVALTIVALVLALPGVFTATGIARFYGFAQIYDWRTALGGIPQAWTLCVEMTFYLFMPVWAIFIARVPGRTARSRAVGEIALLALLFAFSIAYKVWLSARYDPASFQGGPRFMPLPNYLDAFAIGMGLAVVSAWNDLHGVLERPIELVRRRPVLVWAAAAVAVWAAGTRIGFTGEPSQHFDRRMMLERWELQILAGTLLLLPTFFATAPRGHVGRILGRPGLIWLGVVSYGFYLYHYAIITLIDRHLGGVLPDGRPGRFLVLIALAVPLTIAAAAASYYGIERPLLRFKRLFRTGAPVRGEALAEPAPAAPAPAATAGVREPA